jgi:hypothetical protein
VTSSYEPPDLLYFARKFYLSPVYLLGELTEVMLRNQMISMDGIKLNGE